MKRMFRELILDVIEIAKFKCWDNEEGNEKAQEIIDKIHKGKHGSNEGIWIQVDRVIEEEL